jgi:WD40 repeat protein
MVNCLTVGVPISDELIEIATKTGGVYSSNLSGSKDIQLVLKDIYIKTQTDCYGRVKWRSNYSCNPQKKTQITLGNQTISLQYQIPDSMLGFVEASHAEVYFKNNANGDLVYKPIFLKGKNVDLNISAIESSNAQFFGTKQDVLPIVADANQLQKLELSFNPQDSVLASAEYTIKNKGCPDVSVKAYAGGKRKLVITNPLADETYVAGSTVPIRWTGMLNADVIDLYYQKEGDSQWHDIGKGKAGRKSWKAPAINGKVRIKGSRTGDITFSNLMTAPVALMDGSIFKSAFYNRKGSEIISQSINGKLKNWDAKTGQLKHEFEEAIKGEALTFPVSNRIIDLSPNGMNVFTNRNGLLIKDLSTGEGKNLTSLAHKNEQEYYVTLKDFTLLLQNTKYLDETSAPKPDLEWAEAILSFMF